MTDSRRGGCRVPSRWMAMPPTHTRAATAGTREVRADPAEDGSVVPLPTSSWARPIRRTLSILALTAVTLVVLGALSGAARADVGDPLGPLAPDELAGADDVRIRPSGQLVGAGVDTSGGEARFDVVGSRLQGSVNAADGSVALFLEITPIVGKQPSEPRSPERPHARQVNAPGKQEAPGLTSGRGALRTKWDRDTASGREEDGAAITPDRRPLGPSVEVVSGSTGRGTTTFANDGPDVPGLLEHLCLHADRAGGPMTPLITVFTRDPVSSTGPPG
jgi:hypothetical protein